MLAEIVCAVQTYRKLKYLEWKAHFLEGDCAAKGKNAANRCGYL
jgi:hypothetical protein